MENRKVKNNQAENRQNSSSIPKLNDTTIRYLQQCVHRYMRRAQQLDQERWQLLCEAAFLRERLRLQTQHR